jgi:hypothetical protein
MLSPQFDPNLGRAGNARPALETLEERTCPSTVSQLGHTLLITGDNTSNAITLRDLGNGTVTANVLDANGHRTYRTAWGVNLIQVNSGDGDDRIDYALTGALTKPEQIVVNLGQGDNHTSLNFLRGIARTNLAVSVRTGNGDNVVDALFGAIAGSRVSLSTYLGARFNQFNARVYGDVTGYSTLAVYGNAGSGYSGLNFSETGAIAAGSSVAVFFQGGTRPDTFHQNYAGRLDGRLTLTVNGGPAADWIASEVTINAGSTGTLNAQFLGNGGNDVFVVRVRDYSGRLRARTVRVDGGAGLNQAVVTPNVTLAHVSLT